MDKQRDLVSDLKAQLAVQAAEKVVEQKYVELQMKMAADTVELQMKMAADTLNARSEFEKIIAENTNKTHSRDDKVTDRLFGFLDKFLCKS